MFKIKGKSGYCKFRFWLADCVNEGHLGPTQNTLSEANLDLLSKI